MTMLDGVIEARSLMPNGWPGINAALAAMQGNIEACLFDIRVRQACIEILHHAGARGGDREDEARGIFDFVLQRVEYRRDPAWFEFIQDPRILLKHIEDTERAEGRGRGWAAGDCDDSAQLVAILGFQVRLDIELVLVARDHKPFQMSIPELVQAFMDAAAKDEPVPIHVYAAMKENKYAEPSRDWLEGDDRAPSGLISLDTARPGASFREHVPGMVRYVRPAVLTP